MPTFTFILLWIIKIGLWALPILPFYVSPSMLFPFITGKNFLFRIIVEIIAVLWVGLAIADPRFRPKWTLLVKAVSLFIGIVFLADAFSPNAYRAFFSNYERMEGFMMLGHLYLYFLMLTSVFQTRRDWWVFFHISLLTSLVVSYIGLLQRFGYRVSMQGGFRVDSTIGNPTYLAAYLVFHLWLLALFIQRFWKRWWLVALYGAALIFELLILYFTATRGAVLALSAVSILFLTGVIALWPRIFPHTPKMRRYAAGLLAFLAIVPLIFWLMRSSSFVQASPVLRRLTNYSLSEGTIQARFMIWGMSGRGFWDRPILGWGQENYYLVFQKYFNPGLWGDEPWFDRSHNIVFDWLIHTGFVGLTGYFAMLILAGMAIAKTIKKNAEFAWEGLVLGAAFLTHFLQNIFVFDNLNTYLLFFAFLAYTHAYSEKNSNTSSAILARISPKKTLSRQEIIGISASAGLVIIFLIASYSLHIKPIRQSKALLGALQIYQVKGSMDKLIAAFQEALRYDSFGTTEVREQMGNIARDIIMNARFTPEEKAQFFTFAVDELRKESSHKAKDIKHMLFLGALLNRGAELNNSYMSEAEKVLEEAILLSPTKQPLYFELAQAWLNIGNANRAVEDLYTAWNLDRRYKEAGINLWIIAIVTNRKDIATEVNTLIPLTEVGEPELYRLGLAYQQAQDYQAMRDVYTNLIAANPQNPKYHAIFAAVLAELRMYAQARKETEEAVRLDPSFGPEAEVFLKTLPKGKR